jgi:hypothetical protein
MKKTAVDPTDSPFSNDPEPSRAVLGGRNARRFRNSFDFDRRADDIGADSGAVLVPGTGKTAVAPVHLSPAVMTDDVPQELSAMAEANGSFTPDTLSIALISKR